MKIKPGSIIKRQIYGVFWHMGIYIGNGKVVHYHSPKGKHSEGILTQSNAKIRKETLTKFADGKNVYLHAEPIDDKHGKSVVNKAEKFYKNPKDYNGKYNLLTKNCEHFAATCFGDGYAPMKQTTKAAVVLTVMATTALIYRKTRDSKDKN